MPFNAGDIESSLELDRTPFNEGLKSAQADAKKFESNKIRAKIDVNRDELDKLSKTRVKAIQVPANLDTSQIQKQLDRIGDNTETTASRSGSRIARALLNPVVIQLGLLPGIAAASVAAAGLAVTAVAGGFAVLGGVLIHNNEEVKQSFKSLWEEVKSDAKDAAKDLAPYGTEVARELWSGWKTIEPNLRGIFQSLGPEVLELTKGFTGLAQNSIPGIERSVRTAGPTIRGFSDLLEHTGTGLGDFFDQVSSRSAETGRGLNTLGFMIESLLNNLGRLAATFSGAWDKVGPVVSRVFDKLLDAINNLVSGGMPAFTTTLGITMHVLQGVLDLIGPLADILGGSAGWMLGAIVSWKLFAGSIGLVKKAWDLLSPATMAGKLKGFSTQLTNAANATGGFITKASGMPIAGAQFTNVMTKVGKAVTGSLQYIPLLGAAVAGVTAAVDHFFPSADDLAGSISRGGREAEEAHKKIYDVAGGYSRWNVAAGMLAATTGDVAAAIKRHNEGLTDLERHQEEAAAAQRNYQLAVDRFGENSPQAVQAQGALAAATKGVEDAQLRAAQATQTNIDKIIFQTNLLLGSIGARLNYQNSLLGLESAQKDFNTALKEHGPKSFEARQANVQYQQSILGVVTSLGERVKAENADKTETEQSRLATFAMHQEIARLAVIAGKDAPPALLQLAASLSDSELAALGVHKEIDKTGKAVYTLPPGKTLNFPTDAPVAQQQVENLHGAVDALPTTKNLNYVINVVTGNTQGLPANTGLGGLLGIPGRAGGGPVKRGMAYWVNETGEPELFFPSVDGFITNSSDSKRLARGQSGSALSPLQPADDGAGIDWDRLVQTLAAAVARALDGSRLRVDGQEWARLLNTTNLSNSRR